MATSFVSTREELKHIFQEADNIRIKHGSVAISYGKGSKRSAEQNSVLHVWYQEMAELFPEDDALGWKCYCKLHHGVPILRADSIDFKLGYDIAIKGLSYDKKLSVMRIIPVTSLMSKSQLEKYMNQLKEDFSSRGLTLEVKE